MTRLLLTATLALLAGATLTACASAQPAAMLDRADLDNDGRISRSEYQTTRMDMFNRLDRNDDGWLDWRDETRRTRVRQAQERLIAAADRDGDGAVSRPEFAASPMVLFDRADGNGDGWLDAREIEVLRARASEMRN